MKAAVLTAVDTVEVVDVEVDGTLHPDEVRVQTVAAGVCHSDLSYVDGSWPASFPFLPGHEGAGIVTQVGSNVSYVKPRDHVATCVSLFCGQCRYCIAGKPNLCVVRPNRTASDTPRLTYGARAVTQLREIGSFAEEMLVHVNSLVKLPEEVPLDAGALLGCGVLTGTGAVFRTAGVEPGSTVAVVGCGGVGLNVIQGAVLAGASRVIAVDMATDKLDYATKFGATDVVNASEVDSVEAVRELSGGGVDYSFEAVGRPQTASQAVEMLDLGGTATIVGVMSATASFDVKAWTLLRDRRVQGCTMGSNRFRTDIPILADLYLRGRLELDSLITQRFPLHRVNDALETLHGGSLARSIIEFS
jgi:S-(hydroxymethyl)glutathione dehydrogenase/alcohol dehydrogenase